MMCNPEDHPVDFEVYQTPDDSLMEFFGFQYTGNILNKNPVSYHLFLKDSPSTPSMKMSLHNDSNVMLRFVLSMMKIRHAQQAVLNQRPQLQQQLQQQLQPPQQQLIWWLKTSFKIILDVPGFGIRAATHLNVATVAILILLIMKIIMIETRV